MKEIIILIEDGNVFQGTIRQFEDCFFSGCSLQSIKEWAASLGYKFGVLSE